MSQGTINAFSMIYIPNAGKGNAIAAHYKSHNRLVYWFGGAEVGKSSYIAHTQTGHPEE